MSQVFVHVEPLTIGCRVHGRGLDPLPSHCIDLYDLDGQRRHLGIKLPLRYARRYRQRYEVIGERGSYTQDQR